MIYGDRGKGWSGETADPALLIIVGWETFKGWSGETTDAALLISGGIRIDFSFDTHPDTIKRHIITIVSKPLIIFIVWRSFLWHDNCVFLCLQKILQDVFWRPLCVLWLKFYPSCIHSVVRLWKRFKYPGKVMVINRVLLTGIHESVAIFDSPDAESPFKYYRTVSWTLGCKHSCGNADRRGNKNKTLTVFCWKNVIFLLIYLLFSF